MLRCPSMPFTFPAEGDVLDPIMFHPYKASIVTGNNEFPIAGFQHIIHHVMQHAIGSSIINESMPIVFT